MDGLDQVNRLDTSSLSEERSREERLELAHARYMALDRYPVTDLARQFCQLAGDCLSECDEKRKNTRSQKGLESYRRATGAILVDLFLGYHREKSSFSYRPLASGTFSGGPVSYRNFRTVMAALERLELVSVEAAGFYRRDTLSSGRATRYRPTNMLIDIIEDFGITPETLNINFTFRLPQAPLVLRSQKHRHGGSGWFSRLRHDTTKRSIPFVPCDRANQLKAEVLELNQFFSQFTLEGGTHRGYRRIFNLGTEEGYGWNKGGRLYSVGDDSYQSLPKAERSRMRIAGERIVEIDIRASFLSILYAKAFLCLDLSSDPYLVEGIDRSVVKQWVVMTIGHGRHHSIWPKHAKDAYRKETGRELQRDCPIKTVRDAVVRKHPILEDRSERGLSIFDLMYLEAEAMVATMLELKRAYGIPSLSVHDSIIVRESDRCVAAEVLSRNYHRICGVRPEFG